MVKLRILQNSNLHFETSNQNFKKKDSQEIIKFSMGFEPAANIIFNI
jgi:hypothetical protein